MSKTPETSKPTPVATPVDETRELDEEQLDGVSGGIIVINGRDATADVSLGAGDTKMGPSPHMNPGSLTPKIG